MRSEPLVRHVAVRRTTALLSLCFAAGLLSAVSAAGAQPTDPRVGLKAGWADAGEAIRNLELVSHTTRPTGFFDQNNPGSFAVANSDLAFRGNLVFQGNFNGF